MFLEGDGVLALCPEWQRLQPANGTLLDGVARLPKQLLGEPHASSPSMLAPFVPSSRCLLDICWCRAAAATLICDS